MRCAICGKPLSLLESIQRGIGPVCWAKIAEDTDIVDQVLHHKTEGVFTGDVVLKRDKDGSPVVNIRRLVVKHSPDGFEWGYGGSGPADLALNIMLHFTTMEVAEKIYQEFKWKFIAGLPEDGGVLREIRYSVMDQFHLLSNVPRSASG